MPVAPAAADHVALATSLTLARFRRFTSLQRGVTVPLRTHGGGAMNGPGRAYSLCVRRPCPREESNLQTPEPKSGRSPMAYVDRVRSERVELSPAFADLALNQAWLPLHHERLLRTPRVANSRVSATVVDCHRHAAQLRSCWDRSTITCVATTAYHGRRRPGGSNARSHRAPSNVSEKGVEPSPLLPGTSTSS